MLGGRRPCPQRRPPLVVQRGDGVETARPASRTGPRSRPRPTVGPA